MSTSANDARNFKNFFFIQNSFFLSFNCNPILMALPLFSFALSSFTERKNISVFLLRFHSSSCSSTAWRRQKKSLLKDINLNSIRNYEIKNRLSNFMRVNANRRFNLIKEKSGDAFLQTFNYNRDFLLIRYLETITKIKLRC